MRISKFTVVVVVVAFILLLTGVLEGGVLFVCCCCFVLWLLLLFFLNLLHTCFAEESEACDVFVDVMKDGLVCLGVCHID